jgi:hypothetical protein
MEIFESIEWMTLDFIPKLGVAKVAWRMKNKGG